MPERHSAATQWMLTAGSVVLFAVILWSLGVRALWLFAPTVAGFAIGMGLLTRYWLRSADKRISR